VVARPSVVCVTCSSNRAQIGRGPAKSQRSIDSAALLWESEDRHEPFLWTGYRPRNPNSIDARTLEKAPNGTMFG
jgi:hypothetical protein